MDRFHGGDISAATAIGAFNLEKSLRTIHRFFFKFLNAETLINKGAELWSKRIDQGRLEVHKQGPKQLLLKVIDFNSGDEIYCHVLRGTWVGSLTAAGLKDITVAHPECVLRGASACSFVVRWR
ncbi:MAG: hypothetical protein QM765_29280 [Myxococcales bacterium]